MPDLMKIVGTIGVTGKVWRVVLKSTDDDPDSDNYGRLVPTNLTGYTEIKLQVNTEKDVVVMNQVDCVVADAGTGTITCTTDLTTAAHSALISGTHRCWFRGLNAAGKVRQWPEDDQRERNYGVCIIHPAITVSP